MPDQEEILESQRKGQEARLSNTKIELLDTFRVGGNKGYTI